MFHPSYRSDGMGCWRWTESTVASFCHPSVGGGGDEAGGGGGGWIRLMTPGARWGIGEISVPKRNRFTCPLVNARDSGPLGQSTHLLRNWGHGWACEYGLTPKVYFYATTVEDARPPLGWEDKAQTFRRGREGKPFWIAGSYLNEWTIDRLARAAERKEFSSCFRLNALVK